MELELKEHENPTKTSTPSKIQHPRVWYLKWSASIVLIMAMILTANNLYPYNLFLHFLVIGCWLIVSVIWNDRALIVINAVALSIFTNGMIGYMIKLVNNS